MTSCNFVHTCRRFRGTYCLHYKNTLLLDRVGSPEIPLHICQIRRRQTLDDAFRVTAVTMSDLTKVFFSTFKWKDLTYLLTYSTQHSLSWEANRFPASQEITRILWNPKVHYHIYKYPPPVPILSQLDPVHTPKPYFLKIHLNIILPSTPGSHKWSLSLGFPTKTPQTPLLFPYVLHTSPISFFSILSPEQCWVICTDH